jgi:hypothetical protein
METRNAIITDAVIGINSRGILDACITLDYGDCEQVFGNYGLHDPKNGMSGKNYTGYFVYRVLKAAGVDRWEQLKGRPVRVEHDDSHVAAIGHIIANEWFFPGDEFKSLKKDASAQSGEYTSGTAEKEKHNG